MNIKEIHSEQTPLQLICCHWQGDVDTASSRPDPSLNRSVVFFFQSFASEQINEGPEVPFLYFSCLLAVYLMKGFRRFPLLLALINSLMALIVAFF